MVFEYSLSSPGPMNKLPIVPRSNILYCKTNISTIYDKKYTRFGARSAIYRTNYNAPGRGPGEGGRNP